VAGHAGRAGETVQALPGLDIGGLAYSDPELVQPEFEGDPTTIDERQVRRRDFQPGDRVRFLYVYDFGDDWRHSVELEQPLVLEPAPRVASCRDGAQVRPPEDVGGPDGYARFLEVLADPRHEDHRDMRIWAGGHFDPEWFDRQLCDPGRAPGAARRPAAAAQAAAAAAPAAGQ
jgi:Plasmid pRiA4b ORF-3-like protein